MLTSRRSLHWESPTTSSWEFNKLCISLASPLFVVFCCIIFILIQQSISLIFCLKLIILIWLSTIRLSIIFYTFNQMETAKPGHSISIASTSHSKIAYTQQSTCLLNHTSILYSLNKTFTQISRGDRYYTEYYIKIEILSLNVRVTKTKIA